MRIKSKINMFTRQKCEHMGLWQRLNAEGSLSISTFGAAVVA